MGRGVGRGGTIRGEFPVMVSERAFVVAGRARAAALPSCSRGHE